MDLITELIEPESWQKQPGVYARAVPGRLVIRHSAAVHRQIQKLLERLEVIVTPRARGMGGMGSGMSGGMF